MIVIFFGKTGVGKGTYASRVSRELRIPIISTGDLLRKEIIEETPLGKQIQSTVSKGAPVGDLIVSELLEKKLSLKDNMNGFILDGFPFNVHQAQLLEKMLSRHRKKIDLIVYFTTSERTLLDRVLGRLQCIKCGKIYHMKTLPPLIPGVCNQDMMPLYQREDDVEEVVRRRWDQFDENHTAIKKFYAGKVRMVEVHAEGSIESIVQRTIESILLSAGKTASTRM